jgi:hypothetical protein
MEGTIDASSIVVVSGHASAGKVVAVVGMDDEAIRAAIRAPHRSAVHVLKPRSKQFSEYARDGRRTISPGALRARHSRAVKRRKTNCRPPDMGAGQHLCVRRNGRRNRLNSQNSCLFSAAGAFFQQDPAAMQLGRLSLRESFRGMSPGRSLKRDQRARRLPPRNPVRR